jgi:uncharacterized oxidoreductase
MGCDGTAFNREKDTRNLAQLEEFVVVTGASRGIGGKLTSALIDRGHRVIAVGRNELGLAKLRQAYGERVVAYPLDLAEPQACEQFGVYVAETYPILGLINNAAIQNEGALDLQTADEIDREIRTNLTAPAILSARLLPHLPTGRGFIVNLTSGLAIAPKTSAAVYCATKAGLRNLTRGIENQLGPDRDVAMIDIVLPLVDTDMTQGRGSGKISPDAATSAILAAIERRVAVQWVGKAKLLGIVNRLSPALARTIMRRL